MQFRKDINGLRAIAVIAVVLYHFNANWMPGGFAGVDVFFVISGFLMTGIIFRGVEKNNFSILKFYVARIIRIVPALAFLCLILLVFGWFYLSPLDYKKLGNHVSSSIGFFSNFIYWKESGYFDVGSHNKWLLHTWSLSVEWQFYLTYPLVLVIMSKFLSLKALKATILLGTVLGFIFCVVVTYKQTNLAFFLLPTRAWEMMVGGVAYLYPFLIKENTKKFFEWSGLGLIILSYVFISKDNIWPGYLVLIPVIGVYLLIQAQRNDSIITGNRFFQNIGRWSYSIYLWHWPIVVGIFYFSLNEKYIFLSMALSIFLGFLSYKYIESVKFIVDFKNPVQYLKCKSIYFVILIYCLGSYVHFSDGVKGKNNQNIISILDYANIHLKNLNKFEKELKRSCVLENWDNRYCRKLEKDKYDVIVLGDSQAGVISIGINESLQKYKKNARLVNAGAEGCLPVLGMNHRGRKRSYCKHYNKDTYDLINKLYKNTPIIIASRLNLYPLGFNEKGEIDTPYMFFDQMLFDNNYKLKFKNNFIDSMCKLSKNNPVYLIKPLPEFGVSVPNEMVKQIILNNQINIELNNSDYNLRNEYIESVLDSIPDSCRVEIIDTTSAFINSNGNYSPLSTDGMPLYADDNHLNVVGASNISHFFDSIWERVNL